MRQYSVYLRAMVKTNYELEAHATVFALVVRKYEFLLAFSILFGCTKIFTSSAFYNIEIMELSTVERRMSFS